ncbi:MAG: PorT family protein, partial [Prevotellaceae bacterium]|nr:PorT family protein [Prevotellaceae bacterium]
MKKLLLLLGFVGIVGINSVSAQLAWGARVGLCMSTASTSEGGSIDGSPSLELGPTAYYALTERAYLNFGAMLSIKNFESGSESLNFYFIEVPVYIGYAANLGGLSLYGQAGPFFGLKLSESLPEGLSSSNLGSFNAGLGLAAGVNVQKFKFEFGYQQGLTNLYTGGGDFSLTLG